MEDSNINQFFSGDWYQWEEGGYKERAQAGEYGGYIMHSCLKMRTVETVLRMKEGDIKENDGGGELNIYHEHFYKCHNVPSVQY
jgi:hypothetical protein